MLRLSVYFLYPTQEGYNLQSLLARLTGQTAHKFVEDNENALRKIG